MVKNINENLAMVRERIRSACGKAGRDPAEVELMAVSKTQPPAAVEAALGAGLRLFGENRVQEAVEKLPPFRDRSTWELIGHLQSNKARLAVEHFDRIQSVDRGKLISTLARLVAESDRPPLRILLQVNAGDDPAKSGCAVADADALVAAILERSELRLEGLMTIAPLDDREIVARRCFARLRELRDGLEGRFGLALPVLSMGMTGDLEAAVSEGSTLLRVGTALFGRRD